MGSVCLETANDQRTVGKGGKTVNGKKKGTGYRGSKGKGEEGKRGQGDLANDQGPMTNDK
jgi:hypothetical protein